MELSAAVADDFIRHALWQMRKIVESLSDDELLRRPLGNGNNSVCTLVVHTCAVAEFWLGYVVVGLPSTRDRDAEFVAEESRADLLELVDQTIEACKRHLGEVEAGVAPPRSETDEERSSRDELRGFLPTDDHSDAAVILHVIEELFQHLGHAEVTRDAIKFRAD